MKKIKLICIVIIFIFSSVSSRAAVSEYALDNGLKVLLIEDHKAPVATFQIWYKVGARNEPAGKTGISHLLEHMMFKGTPDYGSKEFSKIIKKNGGTDNAYTTKNYTMYYQDLISDRIHLSIVMEADRMVNLVLDPKEVIAERDVVKEERRLRYEDDPQSTLFEEVNATAFKAHPYHNPVIGWMSDISSIERESLNDYYKKYYSPDNAVIVVAGDINPDSVMKMIEENFGEIPRGPAREALSSVEPLQRGEKRVFVKKEAEMPFIIIAFHTPSIPHEDSYALDVLNTIFSGKSGRIYKSLINDKKVAINAFSSYSGINFDPYLFFFGGTPALGKEITELEASFYKEIEKIKKELPSEREIQKAKNQVEAAFIMQQDSVHSHGELIGTFEMLGDWRLKDEYLKKIRKISPQDVKEVANKYFIEDNRTVGVLIPK